MGDIARPGGPRTGAPRFDWIETTRADNAACMRQALDDLERLTTGLADAAVALFGTLDGRLDSNLPIRRNFETVHLTGPEGQAGGLCPRPQAGTSLAAGGDDGITRFKAWRVFRRIPIGVDWGAPAKDVQPGSCQSPKRVLLPFLQTHPVADLQFPEYTHFAVVRVGNVWLGTIPGEATTVTGRQIMAGLRRGIARHRGVMADAVASDSITLVGLVNGYLNYITTSDEYQAQTYEGGSTLYGPHSARFMAGRIEELAAAIATPNPSPVLDIRVRPGPNEWLLAGPEVAKGPETFQQTEAEFMVCRRDLVVVQWIDSLPGAFQPAGGPMVRFSHPRSGNTVNDGGARVEVRTLGKKQPGRRWEIRWRPHPMLRSGDGVQVEFVRWNARLDCAVS
jgi:hypothetical protein